MAKIAKKLTDLVGNTPLMELSGYSGKAIFIFIKFQLVRLFISPFSNFVFKYKL